MSTRSRNCSASLARRKTTTQRKNAASGIRRGAIGLLPISGETPGIDHGEADPGAPSGRPTSRLAPRSAANLPAEASEVPARQVFLP